MSSVIDVKESVDEVPILANLHEDIWETRRTSAFIVRPTQNPDDFIRSTDHQRSAAIQEAGSSGRSTEHVVIVTRTRSS